MSAASHQLPLPVGTRFSAPTRRARVDIWSAPDPRALVIDPWAAPLGPPIAERRVSPWSPPFATGRVTWMAAPSVLLPPPVLAAISNEAASSTERALTTLRSLGSTTEGFAPLVAPGADVESSAPHVPDPLTLSSPVAGTLDRIGTIDPIRSSPLAPPTPDMLVTEDADPSARWRVLAIVAGIGAATAATITLLTSLF